MYSDSLVKKITAERERFIFAWQHGAASKELNEIREHIKELNDLLWETTLQNGKGNQAPQPDGVLTGMRQTA